MNRQELERLIAKDPYMSRVTWGVFERSDLPDGKLLPGAYVVNSQNAPGEHWFLLYVGDRVELLDSLGKHPSEYGLKPPIVFFKHRLQKDDTVTCGLYVLYFLYWRSRGIDMNDIWKSLQKDGENVVRNHLIHLTI